MQHMNQRKSGGHPHKNSVIYDATNFYRESFRCGIFFAGKKPKAKPFEKLFIIPKRFPINESFYNEDSNAPKVYSNDACPINDRYGTADKPSVHKDRCYNIVSTFYINMCDISLNMSL